MGCSIGSMKPVLMTPNNKEFNNINEMSWDICLNKRVFRVASSCSLLRRTVFTPPQTIQGLGVPARLLSESCRINSSINSNSSVKIAKNKAIKPVLTIRAALLDARIAITSLFADARPITNKINLLFYTS